MGINDRFTLFTRMRRDAPRDGAESALWPAAADGRLSGGDLERAYRELLLEYQVLAESNERLGERLARRRQASGDPQTTEELLRVQRNALVERSHRLRELEYENKRLKREQKKRAEENQRLRAELERQRGEAGVLKQRELAVRRELAKVQAALRDKKGGLAAPRRPSSAANGDF